MNVILFLYYKHDFQVVVTSNQKPGKGQKMILIHVWLTKDK